MPDSTVSFDAQIPAMQRPGARLDMDLITLVCAGTTAVVPREQIAVEGKVPDAAYTYVVTMGRQAAIDRGLWRTDAPQHTFRVMGISANDYRLLKRYRAEYDASTGTYTIVIDDQAKGDMRALATHVDQRRGVLVHVCQHTDGMPEDTTSAADSVR